MCIRGASSAWRNVTSGATQGLVVGPFFLMFINNIDCGVHGCVLKFADETKVFDSVQTDYQHRDLQADLSAMVDWSVKWQMQFNILNCNVLHVGHSNQHRQYTMNNQPRKAITEERDL
jgi:hypothetical protein